MPDLETSGLSKSFGDIRVLDDVSFEVGEGEFCILLGPSGCGKTTLLRIIAGLERQDAGEIRVGGEEISDLTPRERDVAMVFQSYALYPHMTAFDNIAFPLKARKVPAERIEERVRETARLLDIEGLLDRRPRELSGGQRQRVAIGRAIVRSPRLFLFDEPLSNLDAGLRTEMRVELAKLHDRLGATMVYVTHDQVEAMTLGDKIVLLHDARIQQIGSPADLYDRPANLFVAGFIGSPRMNLVEGRLERDGEGTVFRAMDADLTARIPGDARRPRGRAAEVAPETGAAEGDDDRGSGPAGTGKVVLGIRPEALQLRSGTASGNDADTSPASPSADPTAAVGRVEVVENIGSEALVHLVVGPERLTARAGSDVRLAAGDDVGLGIPASRVHLFDARDGRALHNAGNGPAG